MWSRTGSPVDFLATRETWTALREYLRIEDDGAVLQHLGIDLRHPQRRYIGPPMLQHDNRSWTDPQGDCRERKGKKDTWPFVSHLTKYIHSIYT